MPFGAEASACRLQPVDERFVRDGQIVRVQDQIDVVFGERGCEIVGGPDDGHAGDAAVSLSWIVVQESDGLVARVAHAGDQTERQRSGVRRSDDQHFARAALGTEGEPVPKPHQ